VAIIYVSRWQRADPIEQAASEGAPVVSLAAGRGAHGPSAPSEATPAAEGAAAFAQKLVAALQEQADDNLRTGLALARAWHAGQVLAIQSRYLRASLARMAEFSAGYVALIHKAMAKAVAEERSRLNRAA
jgi:hypothetical protein